MNSARQLAAFLLEDEGAWDFVSNMDAKYVTVYGSQENWQVQTLSCSVKWHLDMEVRDWGVKEFSPMLREVSVLIHFEVIDPVTGDATGGEQIELKFPSAEATPSADNIKSQVNYYSQNVQAEIEWQRRDDNYGPSIFPREVEIDLRTNHIIVFF